MIEADAVASDMTVAHLKRPLSKGGHVALPVIAQLGKELDEFAELMTQLGYRVVSCDTLGALAGMRGDNPKSILVDVDAWGDDPSAVRETLGAFPEAAVIATATDSGFESRLRAVQSGCGLFLAKPLSWFDLVEVLDRNVEDRRAHPPVVLIVDDDELFVEYVCRALARERIEVHCVSRPVEVLDALVTHQPELLILDVHMNGVDGVEMAAVVRQIPRYASLPIIFLSSEPDGLIRDRARLVGADDFLAKPMTPAQMAVEVRIRVLRGRTIARLIDRDGLTGVLNQRRVRTAVEREIRRARRQDRPLSLAIIDVDRFKSVNDTYGHISGDRVLVMLAKVMRARLRNSDIVGRMGGEEFAVILPETTADTAREVIDEVRRRFREIAHVSVDGRVQFSVSFSAGAAELRPADDLTTLIARADGLLYEAKHGGRDRVIGDGAVRSRNDPVPPTPKPASTVREEGGAIVAIP